MTFKAKSARSRATPVLKLGGQYVNSVAQYKYLGILFGYWPLRWQRRSETTAISILCSKQAANLFFPLFKCSYKCTFFIRFVRPCMNLNYGVISGSHACRDCGWHVILVAELCTTCPGERVLVATKFNVTFLPLRLCYLNTRTCFSKDAENLTTYGYVLW